jgi:hypothetical protein
MEAVINSCPAFAISQEYYEHPDFALAGRAAATVARNILEHGLSPGELINVNVPAVPLDQFDGVGVRFDKRVYRDKTIERQDRGDPYFWIGGPRRQRPRRRGDGLHAVVKSTHRGDAHPPGPDRAASPETPRLGLDTPRRTQRRPDRTVAPGQRRRRLGIPDDLARGILAVLAGDAAARMGPGSREVQTVQDQAVARVAEQRPPQEELVEAVPLRTMPAGQL